METPILKSKWGEGPWQNEPDRLEFRAHGFSCLLKRHMHFGFWCGYVGVPPGHPWHGKGYGDVHGHAHGGLTYAALCDGDQEHGICHRPEPGEPEHVWWIGFDCGHAFDKAPGAVAFSKSVGIDITHHYKDTYRDIEYVKSETAGLAEQALAATTGH